MKIRTSSIALTAAVVLIPFLSGCGSDTSSQALDIPQDNPYQVSDEDFANEDAPTMEETYGDQ